MGLLPSKYQLSVQQAEWVFAIINRTGLGAEILWDLMDPEDKLDLFLCRDGQRPKSHPSHMSYDSDEYRKLVAACEPYRSGKLAFLPYTASRTARVREILEAREALENRPRP